MTVGGSTSGSATSAATGSRQRLAVRASHHAMGVPMTSNRTVVAAASAAVIMMGDMMSLSMDADPTPHPLRSPSPLEGEGGAQRRMRGSVGYPGWGANPSPAPRAHSPSRAEAMEPQRRRTTPLHTLQP